MQSKKRALVESFTQVGLGYFIAVAAQVVIFPIFGFVTELSTNMKIGGIFLVISLVRSYVIRRSFDYWEAKL